MKHDNKIQLRIGVTLLIFLAAFSRMLPHPPNFTPIGAIALFGAAYFSKRHLAILIPVLGLWLSDLAINNILYGSYSDHFVWFYPGFYWTYGAFILIGLLGFPVLKKVKPLNIILASLSASVLFFLVSNFGFWSGGTMYPRDLSGLIACYTAAIPFFKNMLSGDLAYSAALFGIIEFLQYKIPGLKLKTLKSI